MRPSSVVAHASLLSAAMVLAGCASTSPEQPLRIEAAPAPVLAEPTTPIDDPPPVDPKLSAVEVELAQLRARLEAPPTQTAISPFDLPTTDGSVDLRTPAHLTATSEVEPLTRSETVAATPITVEPLEQPAPEPEPTLASFEEPLPATAASAFDRQLDAAISGKPVGDLSGLLPSERRLVETVAEHVAEFRDTLGGMPDVEDQVRPILEAAEALRREVGLTLPTAELCSSVRIFGDYTPVGPEFTAGRPHRVVLYVEADGFQSEQQADGRWLTRLSLSAVLYDEQGRPVMSLPPKPARDVSRRVRRDFFLSGLMTLPAHAAPGRHRLKVTVRDELAGRVAQQSVPVVFVSR
ncbi:MAG: hypothetical protein AAGI46_11400 [Planctomycetota bacterium]